MLVSKTNRFCAPFLKRIEPTYFLFKIGLVHIRNRARLPRPGGDGGGQRSKLGICLSGNDLLPHLLPEQ